jgi:DNA-binding CsgD family transcriptional regulator
LASAVRACPNHRLAALVLVAALVLPPGSVNVSLGDLWPAGPTLLFLALAIAQLGPLWWIGRWPLPILAVIGVAFLVAQGFAWPATSADLSVFVALAAVGARVRPRTALATAAVATVVLDGFMVAAQAPTHPELIGEALVPAAILMGVPVLVGVTYQQLRRKPDAVPAPPAADPPTPAPTPTPAPAPAPARPMPDPAGLTARELMILRMVAEGLTNTEIAAELKIGRETVKTHVGNILAKLGARDRTHAVTVAYRARLIGDTSDP